MTITQVGANWQFSSEFALEEIVWKNLPQLLNLKPLKRQFYVQGQVCDILALDDQQRLVVLELKNTEDRYVVQQLTRYYAALKDAAPFSPEIDTEHIRLIAIAPSFHQDTLTDCKYTVLKVELMSFQLQPEVDKFTLLLRDRDSQIAASLSLLHSPTAVSADVEVSEPPRKLLNWLSYCSEAKFNAIIATRQQILKFDRSVKEIFDTDRILYGKSKSKLCAEIRSAKTISGNGKVPVLFIWLPDPDGKAQVLRLMIDLDQTGTMISRLTYCPRQFEQRGWWKFPGFTQGIGSYSNIPDVYKPLLDGEMNCSLLNLVELALKTWQERL